MVVKFEKVVKFLLKPIIKKLGSRWGIYPKVVADYLHIVVDQILDYGIFERFDTNRHVNGDVSMLLNYYWLKKKV